MIFKSKIYTEKNLAIVILAIKYLSFLLFTSCLCACVCVFVCEKKISKKSRNSNKMLFCNTTARNVVMLKPSNNPANIYFFKGNNRNNRKRCEICPKLTIKTPDRRQ